MLYNAVLEWLGHAGGLSLVTLAVVLFLTSLVLEDAALALGLYWVGTGIITTHVCFVILALSIAIGDGFLYGAGRWLHRWERVKKIRHTKKFKKIQFFLKQNALAIIMVSRFIPGMRLPTYTAAGLMHVSWILFFCVVVFASVVWTGGIVYGGASLVDVVKNRLHMSDHQAACAIILAFVIIQIGLNIILGKRKNT